MADLDAEKTAEIVARAADVALVIEDGVIQDVALANSELAAEGYAKAWRGKRWVDTVTTESRRKIEELLASTERDFRWRQVNHPSQTALDVPIKYTAIEIGPKSRMVVLGRDLRSVSMLQQRLVEAHQKLERDYTRLREAETRYKLLFDSAVEAVLIVSADSLAVREANAAAARAMGVPTGALVGASLGDFIVAGDRRALDIMVAEAAMSGAARTEEVRLSSGGEAQFEATAFREDRETFLIVRILSGATAPSANAGHRIMLDALERLPDGLAVIDSAQQILVANQAFRDLAKVSGETEAVPGLLQDYLGRSPTDLNVLFSTLRKHGVVRNFATVLKDRFGEEEPVEVSAVSAPSDRGEMFAVSIRGVARRLSSSPGLSEQIPSRAGQFTDLVGRVPLKDIVKESTVLIEKLCIAAALEITENNRASAAEMLGLSRQGLYSKIKRAGLDAED
ncbi:MAG: transcriptional regulator PpsR [Pseudomonadota bacterium]